MTSPASLARIFSDLIKADTVIDGSELERYSSIRKKFGITPKAERLGGRITLEEALHALAKQSESKRSALLQECFALAVSDGFCAYSEALLLLTYYFCLRCDITENAEVISIAFSDIQMDDNQVLFIESGYHSEINNSILQHYRNISNEFRLVGFNFVYIPYIAEHYRQYNRTILKDVTTFLAPHLSEDDTDNVIHNLSSITTADFCTNQLYLRLEISSLQTCQPSLLLKISKNFVGNKSFINFLRIPVGENVLQTVRNVVDFLKNRINTETFVIPNVEEANEQFLYHGFYKQLFDMYTIKHGIESSLLVDFDKKELRLPEIGITIDHLRRKEKAFYVLLLAKSQVGGLNFNYPKTAEELIGYQKRILNIQNEYGLIYALFGGKKDETPDIENPEIRRPMISSIRKRISQISDGLHSAQNFTIVKDKSGNYRIPLSPDLISVKIGTELKSIDELL